MNENNAGDHEGKKDKLEKKGRTRTKMSIDVNISFNPSIKLHWEREKESE